MLYVNISQGYKSGGFPALGLTSSAEFTPTRQESLLAYEGGIKSSLFDRNLVLDAAIYYYDYDDKQTQGDGFDPLFGPVEDLVNIPRSHILGFEISGAWRPVDGLTITPSMNYADSRVDGCKASDDKYDPNLPGGIGCYGGAYHNYDNFGIVQTVTGSPLPFSPRWQADVDAEYDWPAFAGGTAFIGANVNYQSESTAAFYGQGSSTNGDFNLPGRTLVDLRAGVEKNAWRFQVFGRNITNAYYVTSADHLTDEIVRYTGMPATYGVAISYRFH